MAGYDIFSSGHFPESFAILIAAGDPEFRRLLRKSLLATGFVFDEVPSTQAALDLTRLRHFDLVLIDRDVPDRGADEACRLLRTRSATLGIMVVRAEGAEGSAEDDERRMLDAGADDCVDSPFRYREIVARMGAILRRPRMTETRPRGVIRAGKIELDSKNRLILRDGIQVHLTPREFDLIAALMANAGTALTHTKLARSAWGSATRCKREYLRTYVQSLRRKLESDPARPRHILTQPWVGYRFSL
jgi:two-component system KDP operon response regulator KdpE